MKTRKIYAPLTEEQKEFVLENKGKISNLKMVKMLNTSLFRLQQVLYPDYKAIQKSGKGVQFFNVHEEKNWIMDDGGYPKINAINYDVKFGNCK